MLNFLNSSNKKKFLFLTAAISVLIFAVVFLMPSFSLAQQNDYGLNYAANVGLSTEDIRVAVVRIIRNLLGILGLIALAIMLYAGILWMTSQGDSKKIDLAKKILLNAVIGLIIIMMAFAIVQWIFSVLSSSQQAGSGELCQAGQCYGCMRCQNDQSGYIFDVSCDVNSCDSALGSDAFSISDIQTSHGDPLPGHYETDPDKSNVYWCSKVQTIFNHNADSQSVADSAANGSLRIAVSSSGTAIPGDWQVRGNIMSFTPLNNEFTNRNTDHTKHLPQSLTDDNGKILSNCSLGAGCETSPPPDFGWNFYVGNEGDTQAPYIVSTYPQSSDPDHPDTNVSRDPVIDVTFSENVDATTVTDVDGTHPYPGHIYLYELDNNHNIVQQVSNDILIVEMKDNGFRLHLDPPNLLKSFTNYQVVVKDITDLCGNLMDPSPYEWVFATNDQAPGVTSYYPTGDNVCPDSHITITYNTSMYYNQLTFTIQAQGSSAPSSYILNPSTGLVETTNNVGSGNLAGTFRVVDQAADDISTHYRVYEFVPDNDLTENTIYHIEITTDKVIDAEGNTLNQSWQFTTSDLDNCVCTPYISYLSQTQGPRGDCLTINGYCFTGTQSKPATISHIYFDSTDAMVGAGYSANAVGTTVPDSLNAGTRAQVSLTIDYGTGGSVPPSNSQEFLVTDGQADGPCLWSIEPDHGQPGSTKVTLTGIRFGDYTKNSVHQVTFYNQQTVNITAADKWTDTKIVDVIVPAGTTDGQVVVTNDQGTSNGLPFDAQYCGDGVVDPGEDCDGTNLNNKTCADVGWLGGELACSPTCHFDTSNCSNAPQVIESNRCESTCDQGENDGLSCQSDTNCPGGQCLISVSPSPNPFKDKQDVCLNSSISAEFNTDINTATFNSNNIYLQKCPDSTCSSGLSLVPSQITAVANRSFVLSPNNNLDADSWYQVTLTTGITSTAGIAMQSNYVWRFKTAATSDLCPLDKVDVKPDEQTAGANQTLPYYAVPLGPDCAILQSAAGYNWQWSVDEPSLGTTVTQDLTDSSHATVLTGNQKGTTHIRAQADGKYDNRGLLNINFETCTTDSDCADPDGDGVPECAGSVCDLSAGGRCTPLIQSLDPAEGPVGRWVTLHGCHFKSERGNGHIEFQSQSSGSYTVETYPCNEYWTDNQIIAAVPNSIPGSGNFNVQLFDKYNLGSNQDKTFHVLTSCLSDGTPVPASGVPGVCVLEPNSGMPQSTVNVKGENFGTGGKTDDYVSFSGTNAQVDNWSNQNIKVSAPNSSSGNVVVYTESCPSNGVYFEYNSGNIGDACNADNSGAQCVANDNLCWPGLYCDSHSCTCQQAPQASVIEPSRYPYPRVVCRNGAIGATFDRLMDRHTLNNQTISLWHKVVGDKPADNCLTNGALNDSGQGGGLHEVNYLDNNYHSQNYLSIIINYLKNWLSHLFNPVQAQQSLIWWCPVSGSVSSQDVNQGNDNCNNPDGCTKFVFAPDEPLANNADNDTFELNILGGKNGVKTIHGAELNTNSDQRPYSDQPSYYWSFSLYSNTKICQIDHVNVDVTYKTEDGNHVLNNTVYDYFTCAGRNDCTDDMLSSTDGNQHRYYAQAYDAQGVVLSAAYTWSEYDNANLIEMQSTDRKVNYITANPYNGSSIVRVIASDPDPDDSIVYGSAVQAVNITNFLCQNPWPSLTTFPFQDTGGNCEAGSGSCLDMTFSTYYCRDWGHNDNFCLGGKNDGQSCQSDADCPGYGARCADFTEDDLPAPADGDPVIKSAQPGYCVGGSQHGQSCHWDSDCAGGYCSNVLKEYMFTFQQGRCVQHGTICSVDNDCPADDICENINDLIGIRVYNNGEHLSPAAWYQKYANQPGNYSAGKLYDGYQSVVSGRTTYINAAVDNQPTNGHQIYTDMFLVSHTDHSSSAVSDIYQQLLDNLRFNTNGIDDVRLCSTSDQYCEKDSDCPSGETCNADKTKLARDTIRMGHISEMIYHLDLYRGYCSRHQNLACLSDSDCPDSNQADNPETCTVKNQTYPLLESGTYLQGQSTSVWDSWQNTFAQLLGTDPLLDPLNEVFCDQSAGYNQECWNEETEDFQCHGGSHFYHYQVADDGQSYVLETNMEYSNNNWNPQPAQGKFWPIYGIDLCYNLQYSR